MLRIKSATRLAITIGLIFASLMWMAVGIGILPDPEKAALQNRISLAKSIASNVATYAEGQRIQDLRKAMQRVAMTNDELLSIGVMRSSGYYVAQTDEHLKVWKLAKAESSTKHQIAVKVFANNREWGWLQIAFRDKGLSWMAKLWRFPVALIACLSSTLILLSWFVLARTFRYLNPSQVVPTRVRSALDTLTEGLVLIDKTGEIAHANQAFGEIVGWDTDQLIGSSLADIEWTLPDESDELELPWEVCQASLESVCGQIVDITLEGKERKFIVNATPIESAKGEIRGILVSFDDVTTLESKKHELAEMIRTLRASRDEVERQNEKLNFLASYDPLTKCLNRRSFWIKYEKMWESNERGLLSLFMVDVDFFKKVNDNHGHSVGDDVLRETGAMLTEVVGERGLVCRYGGEEFAIAVPKMDLDGATEIATEFHAEFQNRQYGGLNITASIGVSNTELNAMDPQHMLDQADQCLYAAKRNGRNQIVRFDNCPALDAPPAEVEEKPVVKEIVNPIQYSAVTGLLSALSFRSKETAEHSLRVADLSVAIAKNYLTKRQIYNLEVSALLHDIGKIGVPDSILNKPGPLTTQEWEIMNKHDEIGVEIVRSAFASEEISKIIESHHFCFAMRKRGVKQLIFRDEIPLSSRIISVCDAYDSMTSDRVYRLGMKQEAAFNELRRCAPDQFDPELVENLIEYVSSSEYKRTTAPEIYTTPRSAVVLGQHIERLYDAIDAKNVEQLRNVVNDLKLDATESNVEPLSVAADELQNAIPDSSEDFEQILILADEIMELCRSTRNSFVSNAQQMIEG